MQPIVSRPRERCSYCLLTVARVAPGLAPIDAGATQLCGNATREYVAALRSDAALQARF